MPKQFRDLVPGDTLHDMHNGPASLGPNPLRYLANEHRITNVVRINTSKGAELIENAVQEAGGQLRWHYINKLLVVIETLDETITAGWSYDGRMMGLMTIHVRNP